MFLPAQIMLNKAFLFLLFLPITFTKPLDKYILETRKSIFLNSLLQNSRPCQLTLIANHPSMINFFVSPITQVIQIFVLHDKHGQYKQNISIFPKLKENYTYSVYFGQKYIVKFNTPTCKLNVLIFSAKQSILNGIFFAFRTVYGSGRHEFNIASNNHLPSRSVYTKSNTFYLQIYENDWYIDCWDQDTVSSMLSHISRVTLPLLRFWAVTLVPLDAEFMLPKMKTSIWFVTLIKYSKSTLLDEQTCELCGDSYLCKSV